MKKVLLGVTGLVIVGVGGVWIAANHFLDSATIAQQLKKEMATRYQRDLVFNGQLETAFFPKVQIVLPPTTLSYAGKTQPQFSVTGARVGVALLPLLKGDVQFDAVEVTGLKGTINLKRATQKVDAQKAKATPQSQKAPETPAQEKESFIKNLRVASVKIADSALTVYGLQDKKIYAVTGLNLQTGELALAGTTPVSFATKFEEKTQGITGSLSLNTQVTYDIAALDATLDNLAANLTIKKGDGELEAGLQAAKIAYLERDLEVEKPTLMLKTKSGASAVLSVASARTIEMNKWEVKGASGQVLMAPHNVTFSGYFLGSIKDLSVMTNTLSGKAETVLGGVATTVPFKGNLEASVAQDKAQGRLTGTFDSRNFTVDLRAQHFANPSITGNVHLAGVTLDKWLAQKPAEKKTAALSLSVISEAVAQEVADFAFLNQFNANVGVNVGEVRYGNLPVEQIAGRVLVQGGVLTMKDFSARVADGKIAATAKLNAQGGWSVTQSAQGVRVEKLLAGLGQKEMLAGSLAMTTNVSGVGVNDVAIKKSARGTVDVTVNNAKLKGISLEKVAAAVREKDVRGIAMSPADQTQFTKLAATMRLADGTATLANLTGQSAVASVSGVVQLGLLDESIKGNVEAVLATSKDGRRVTVPIAITGKLSDTSYQIDVARAVTANVTQEVRQKVDEKIKEGLGKLLERHLR